jgi:hypothetical protein
MNQDLRTLATECKTVEIDFADISPNQGSTSCDKLTRAYISACSPDVVLALLDERDALLLLRNALNNEVAVLRAAAQAGLDALLDICLENLTPEQRDAITQLRDALGVKHD